MPDTGAAAGQEVEGTLWLHQGTSPLSYANAAAFELAGWELVWRVAQATQTFTYTLQPHPDTDLAADGAHLVVVTLVNGEGDLIVKKPTTGTGWRRYPWAFRTRAESTDQDDAYNAILRGVGVAPASSQVTTVNWEVRESDSFARLLTILETAVTLWGFTAEDLTDATKITLEAAARLPSNRDGIPNGWIEVTVVSATTGDDPVLRLSWITFPAAVTNIQEGMTYPTAVTGADDDIVPPLVYNYDVQAKGAKSIAITGVSVGSKTFTMNGDQRRWFSVGGSFAITGSTGNDLAAYTITAISYSGGATTVTVSQTPASAVADGNVGLVIRFTVADGKITVPVQATRT